MKFKRFVTFSLVAALCLSIVPMASAAKVSDKIKAEDFRDFDDRAWYAEAVEAAVDDGLLIGTDKGLLEPDGNLTRAEMAAVINRSFGAYEKTNIRQLTDVSLRSWYYEDIQKAYHMGTYIGTSDTTMNPDAAISRQEIMIVVARAMQLDLDRYEDTDLSKFKDAKRISDWALPYVKAMVGAGYIQGRDTGLAPLDNITRAEFSQVFFNIISEYILESGEYTGDRDGNLLIRTEDVKLTDMVIDGDLILGNGVADGKIELSNVTVTGRVVVWGGGTEAVYANNGTDVEELIVCRVDDAVKVIFDRDSTLRVYGHIDVEITERAQEFKETEVIFYDISDIMDNLEDLNDHVNQNQIKVTVSADMYAIVEETNVELQLENNSKSDVYQITIKRNDTEAAIADMIELKAGESCKQIIMAEALEYGDYPCTVTVTALRDGEILGTLDLEATLHVAHMWAAED